MKTTEARLGERMLFISSENCFSNKLSSTVYSNRNMLLIESSCSLQQHSLIISSFILSLHVRKSEFKYGKDDKINYKYKKINKLFEIFLNK